MKEPLGDKLFLIAIIVFGCVYIFGWIMLFTVMFLQWVLPKFEDRIEYFSNTVAKPLRLIQKYSIYCGLALFLFRLIAGWLGWASPLNITERE